MIEIKPAEYDGTYMHYGVREHGMAAAMNGIALHGGLIPYGGTFLCFSDYCRPSIRLAALMQVRTIFVMTHDLSAWAKTDQPISPSNSWPRCRGVPHLAVYRPGDPIETAECWEAILNTPARPPSSRFRRQPMPLLRREPGGENKSAKGAYILLEAEGGERKLTILSTGSELHLAVEAREILRRKAFQPPWYRCRVAYCSSSRVPPKERRARQDTGARRGRSCGRTRMGALHRAWRAGSSECIRSARPEKSTSLQEVRHHRRRCRARSAGDIGGSRSTLTSFWLYFDRRTQRRQIVRR